MDQYNEPASLHTLATVYAELGKVSEARDVLMALLQNRDKGDLESADWYILGRIAEHYDVLDEARGAYKNVEAPEDGSYAISTKMLADRRLMALATEDKKGAEPVPGSSAEK